MPIALQCTCGRALKLRDQLAGKLVQCPSCAASLRVPSPGDDVEVLDTPPPPSHRAPMRITEFVEEHNPIRPTVSAGNSPPQIKTPSTPPPLPGVLQPKLPPAAAEEEIPEFGDVEVVEDTDAALPSEPDADLLQMAYDDHWSGKSAPTDPRSEVEIADDGDDWENARLKAMPAQATSNGDSTTTHAATAQDDDESGSYQLAADTGTGLDLSSVGPLSDVCLDTESVTCLAYGADHKTHLAADRDEMFLLDFAEHDYTRLPRMHGATIRRMVISIDCRLALSGDEGGGLMLWDVVNREPSRWLDGHRSGITAAAFSPDGKYAASGGIGGAVWLWRVPSGEMLSLHQGQMEDAINCLAFSPDGRLLVAISSKGRARLWRVADRMPAIKLDDGATYLRSVAFSKDGKAIIAGSGRRMKMCKWDVETGLRLPAFLGYSNKQIRIQKTWVCPEGSCLVALGFRLKPPQQIQKDVNEFPLGSPIFWRYGMAAWLLRETVSAAADAINEMKTPRPIYYLELWDALYERGLSNVIVGFVSPTTVACSADAHRVIAGFEDGSVVLFGL